MNERIRIELVRRNQQVRIAAFDPAAGLVLENETSAWPIPFAVSLSPQDDPITRAAIARVRRTEDWREGPFRFLPAVRNGALWIFGAGTVDQPNSLPPAGYTLEIRVSDTHLEPTWDRFRLRQGEVRTVRYEMVDRKRFERLAESEADPATLRVLENPASQLDGELAWDWLENPRARTARKACLLNLLAKLRATPTPLDPLIQHAQSVQFADVDRAAVAVGHDFLRLVRSVTGPGQTFTEDHVIHPIHERLKAHLLGAAAPDYDLKNFRQRVGSNSMQLIIAEPRNGDAAAPRYAELDIDLANPWWDALGFFTHIGELIDPGKTDHIKLYRKLKEDSATGDFLAYRLS